jgi:DNA invertase Pin-like site-specific DNA recombinase
MPHVFIYARASADPDDLSISVERQIKLCCDKATELWPDADVQIFRDDALSAADPDVHRPGYADFLTAVRTSRKGGLVGVVVNEQSRLTRQGSGAWDELVVTLTRAGLSEVVTLRSGRVSIEVGNRLVGRILAVVDQEEVERIKARVGDAHRQLFAEGRPSGPAGFGYRSAKDQQGRATYEVVEAEAALVRQIYSLALAGHSHRAVAGEMNQGEIPPRSAERKYRDGRKLTRWSATTIKSILRSPTLAGLRAHTDEQGVLSTTPAQWPAIVSVAEWDAAQRLLARPAVVVGTNGEAIRVRTQPAARPRAWVLSGGRRRGLGGPGTGELYGLLRCGRCGFPLAAQSQTRRHGGKVAAFSCHRKLGAEACGSLSISPADEVERLIVRAVQIRLGESEGLRERLAASGDAEGAILRAERDAARGRMLRAAELLGSGAITEPEFEVMRNPAKAALDVAQARLDSLTSDIALPSVEDVQERWDALTLTQQRAVLERLIGSITVSPAKQGGYRPQGSRGGLDESRLGEPVWLLA